MCALARVGEEDGRARLEREHVGQHGRPDEVVVVDWRRVWCVLVRQHRGEPRPVVVEVGDDKLGSGECRYGEKCA